MVEDPRHDTAFLLPPIRRCIIFICHITNETNVDYVIKVVSTRTLHFVINRYSVGGTLTLCKHSIPHQTLKIYLLFFFFFHCKYGLVDFDFVQGL